MDNSGPSITIPYLYIILYFRAKNMDIYFSTFLGEQQQLTKKYSYFLLYNLGVKYVGNTLPKAKLLLEATFFIILFTI